MIEESPRRPNDTRRSLLSRGAVGLGAVGVGLIAAEGSAGAQISEPWVRRDRMPANVKDYGAKADGSDDSAAFTAALQAADGGTVFVPRGAYTIGDVSFTSHHQSIVGEGLGTYLVAKANAAFVLKMDGRTGCSVRSLAIDGRSRASAGIRIRGLNLINGGGGSTSQLNSLERVVITQCSTGLVVDGADAASQVDKNACHHCVFQMNGTGALLNSMNAQEQLFEHCDFSHNDTGIRLTAGSLAMISSQLQHTRDPQSGVGIEINGSDVEWVYMADVISEGPETDINGLTWPRDGVHLKACVLQGKIANVYMGPDNCHLYAEQSRFNFFPTQGTGRVVMHGDNCAFHQIDCNFAQPTLVMTGANPRVIKLNRDGIDMQNGFVRASMGVTTMVRTGQTAISDADFLATPPDGTLAVTTPNDKLWVRSGGAWKSTTLV